LPFAGGASPSVRGSSVRPVVASIQPGSVYPTFASRKKSGRNSCLCWSR